MSTLPSGDVALIMPVKLSSVSLVMGWPFTIATAVFSPAGLASAAAGAVSAGLASSACKAFAAKMLKLSPRVISPVAMILLLFRRIL